MKPKILLPIGMLAVIAAGNASAAVSYGTVGGLYGQDFDNPAGTAGNFVNDSTFSGWHAVARTGAVLPNGSAGAGTISYLNNDGDTPAVGNLMSLGVAGSSDRALGSQSHNSGTSLISYGVQLINTTTTVLTSFTLTYTGEQWRKITGESADALSFDYQIFSTTGSLSASTPWTTVAALGFTAPQTGSSDNVIGNDDENRKVLTATINNISWNPGEELWLRWTDASGSSTRRAMLGIDDLSFTAVPEPASAGFLAIAALASLRRRRI